MSLLNNKTKASLSNIINISKLFWESSKKMAIISLLLRVLRAVQIVLALRITKLVIDEIVKVKTKNVSDTHLWELLAFELGLTIFSIAIYKAGALIDKLSTEKFIKFTTLKLIAHASSLDLQHFENPFFYDKLDRSNGYYQKRLELINGVLNQFQSLLLLLSLAAGLIATKAWPLIFVPALVLPGFLGERHFSSKFYALFYDQTTERRELYYYYQLGTSASSAKEIRIFGLSNFVFDRLVKLYTKFYVSLRKLAIKSSFSEWFFSTLGNLGYYAVYVIIVVKTVNGVFSLGDLMFLTASYRQLCSSVESFLSQFNAIKENSLYVKDFFDFFKLEPIVRNNNRCLPIPRPIKIGFEFKDVSFKYHNSDRMILKNVNVKIGPGEKIALVGENGAGKTTFVKLLSRLYDPTGGMILLDGIDLKDYDVEDLRRNIGVIFQDFLKYEMSFSDNIAVGDIKNQFNNEKIIDAASKSLVSNLVEKYPLNYQTLLGRTFHEGIELSGGEWQKVAIARAYMSDSQLLILDEPTSALDAKSEYFIYKQFSELSKNTCAVFISHRFSTVRLADNIIVLNDGRIIEMGSHQQLLSLGGRYAELFKIQADGYK